MVLYHYYEKSLGAFNNLSDLPIEEAEEVLTNIKQKRVSCFAAKRDAGYMKRRVEYEELARELFIQKGGLPIRRAPHYMVVESCEWLNSWYEEGRYVKIPIDQFDLNTVSFTYGDMHPTLSPRVNDGKEYRKKVYTYDEILKIIDQYGLPQIWNGDGRFGPERYIEVQIWSDETINRYKSY